MIIQAAKPREKVFYPNIQNNLELPESDRFGFVLTIPNRARILKIIDNEIDGEEIKQEINTDKYLKVHVKKLVNAPEIQDGNIKRKMKVDDLFLYSALDEIYTQVLNEINQFRGSVDIKK